MSNQDERLGSLLILSDLALILSTYGVLFAFNYLIEPINANTWIICTFFVGIKILIVGISDITGIGRYYVVSLLFVLIADVIIFLINQLMAFSLSLRLILFMTIVDMVMVVIAIFIWKRITKQNFRPIEPEGISWDDEEFEESNVRQPVLETSTVGSNDVFHFDSIEPEEEVSENIVEDVATPETGTNEGFINFNELTEELPTQEEIEKQLAFDEELGTTESDLFMVESPQTNISDEEAVSNINFYTEETTENKTEEPQETEDNILFVTDEGPLYADDKLSKFVDNEYFSSNEEVEPEASEIEALAEADTVVEEIPEEEPLEVEVEEETGEIESTLEDEPIEEPVTTEAIETVEPEETTIFTTSNEPEEPVFTEPEEPLIPIIPKTEEVEATSIEEESEPTGEEFNIFNYTSDQIFNQEQSEAEVLEEADTVEEQKSTTDAFDDLFNVPLFNESSESETEEPPIMTTNVEEEDSFYIENIYDYNDITGSTIGFNKRFSPIPFNVTQDQLYTLTNDVKTEMIRFNDNLSKLIDAYNKSLPSSKSNEKINDLISLTNQDSINDADRIIRNKIDLLNQKGFVSEGLIHNFVEIINKLNNRVYSIEIAQENLNEKLKLEKEREAEQYRQQRLREETHRTPASPFNVTSQTKEYTSKEEPMLSESEVLLRNDDMDIIIDSADLELLKEFMAQQEKND